MLVYDDIRLLYRYHDPIDIQLDKISVFQKTNPESTMAHNCFRNV